MASREHSLTHPVWEGREADFLPLTSATSSDSANLDMLAEFLVSAPAVWRAVAAEISLTLRLDCGLDDHRVSTSSRRACPWLSVPLAARHTLACAS